MKRSSVLKMLGLAPLIMAVAPKLLVPAAEEVEVAPEEVALATAAFPELPAAIQTLLQTNYLELTFSEQEAEMLDFYEKGFPNAE